MAQTRPAPAPFGAADPQRPRIGILALQGDVREHANALREVGAERRADRNASKSDSTMNAMAR